MNAHDFHFPDVCFVDSVDKKFIITIIPEKEPAYYQVNFGELVTTFIWGLQDYFKLLKNPKEFIVDGQPFGFVTRAHYDIYYIKECMLSSVPKVEWNDSVLIDTEEDFKVLYNLDEDCMVKVICLKKTIPDLKSLNNEYRTNKL